MKILATFLTGNKMIQDCFFTDTLIARLNCCMTFIKTAQFEASITIYCSVFMITILNYLQKYHTLILRGLALKCIPN